MQWIADVITTDIAQYERFWSSTWSWAPRRPISGAGERHLVAPEEAPEHRQGLRDHEALRDPRGIGAHRLEPIAFTVREGLVPDFYFKNAAPRPLLVGPRGRKPALHGDVRGRLPDHTRYHDNLFCTRLEETIEFMREVKVPWIAFKVLAAGAIPPEDGAPLRLPGRRGLHLPGDVRLPGRGGRRPGR